MRALLLQFTGNKDIFVWPSTRLLDLNVLKLLKCVVVNMEKILALRRNSYIVLCNEVIHHDCFYLKEDIYCWRIFVLSNLFILTEYHLVPLCLIFLFKMINLLLQIAIFIPTGLGLWILAQNVYSRHCLLYKQMVWRIYSFQAYIHLPLWITRHCWSFLLSLLLVGNFSNSNI